MKLMKRFFHAFDEYMSQAIILVGVLIILIYTGIVLFITLTTSNAVPDSLTNGVFGFFGVEFLSLAGIKITKHFRIGKSIEDTVNDILDSDDSEEEVSEEEENLEGEEEE